MRITLPWHRCVPGSVCDALPLGVRAAQLAATCGCEHSHTLVLDHAGRIVHSEGSPTSMLLGYSSGALDGIHLTHLVEDAELPRLEELLAGGGSEVLHVRDVHGEAVECRAALSLHPETAPQCAQRDDPVLHVLHLHASGSCHLDSRTRLRTELEGLLRGEAREAGAAGVGAAGVGIALLDLDGFRLVNESLGWDVGDGLLQRLEARLADADDGAHWHRSGRIGDDEFYLIVRGSQEELEAATTRAQELLATPVTFAEIEEVALTAGAGWAWTAEELGGGAAELLRRADVALGAAKRAGQGEIRGGSPEETRGDEQLRLAHELRTACERPGAEGGALVVHYQPTVDLQTGAVHGVEALVRWQHPDRGLLAPGVFLPLAEESELISRIGQIVLSTACVDGAWLRSHAGCEQLQVSVNIVARQLQQLGFVEQVEQSLSRAGLEPGALVLEVTEQTTIADGVTSGLSLQLLRELGVSLAIDDFGTGYSALAYLPDLPAQILKIDRQFVQQIEAHPGQARLVRAITHLAHEFEMSVVAEGVEEPGQHQMLQQMGCEVGQGYLYSRPVARADLLAAIDGAAAAAARHSREVPGPNLSP